MFLPFKISNSIALGLQSAFLELKYSSKASMTAISRTLNIAEITAYRKREDILNKLDKAIAS